MDEFCCHASCAPPTKHKQFMNTNICLCQKIHFQASAWEHFSLTWWSLGSWLSSRPWQSLWAHPWCTWGAWQALQSWEARVTCGETEMRVFEILFPEDARQMLRKYVANKNLISASNTSCLGLGESLLFVACHLLAVVVGKREEKERKKENALSYQ